MGQIWVTVSQHTRLGADMGNSVTAYQGWGRYGYYANTVSQHTRVGVDMGTRVTQCHNIPGLGYVGVLG